VLWILGRRSLDRDRVLVVSAHHSINHREGKGGGEDPTCCRGDSQNTLCLSFTLAQIIAQAKAGNKSVGSARECVGGDLI